MSGRRTAGQLCCNEGGTEERCSFLLYYVRTEFDLYSVLDGISIFCTSSTEPARGDRTNIMTDHESRRRLSAACCHQFSLLTADTGSRCAAAGLRACMNSMHLPVNEELQEGGCIFTICLVQLWWQVCNSSMTVRRSHPSAPPPHHHFHLFCINDSLPFEPERWTWNMRCTAVQGEFYRKLCWHENSSIPCYSLVPNMF